MDPYKKKVYLPNKNGHIGAELSDLSKRIDDQFNIEFNIFPPRSFGYKRILNYRFKSSTVRSVAVGSCLLVPLLYILKIVNKQNQ